MSKYLDFEGTSKLIQEIKRKDSQILSQLESGLNDKADKSTTYTKTEVGELISPKANSADLSTVATSGSYNDLSDKPHIPEDQVQADWNESDTNDSSFIQNKPTNVSAFINDAGYLTQHQDISGKANSADLSTVATSGSYNDLSDKPTIPTVPTNVSSFTNDSKYVTENDMQVDIIDDNGHDYVDLGLPSGTLWATMNVGASSETDYGNYYQYGKGAAQYEATSGDSNYSGTENPLDSSVDTAVQVWGGSWHMPTRAQMKELTANTTYEWTTINGVNGGKFTAANGNYVFFPAAGRWFSGSQDSVGGDGYYWGSSPDDSGYACLLYFRNGSKGISDNGRKSGYSVRGVLNASKSPKYATKAELNAEISNRPTVMGASGSGHKGGLVPDTSSTAGTAKFLREDGTWNIPSYVDLSNTPTNVSTFTNDANYVTQDTLDDILGVDVNGLTQIKEVLSDDDTTTGLINLIGQKVDAEDIQSITSTEINRLFNPALFLRTSAEADTTSIVVNELGKVVKFDLSGTQYVLVSTSGSISSAAVSQYADSIAAFGQATAALEVTDSNGTWEFAYNGTTYTFSSNAVSPVIAQF